MLRRHPILTAALVVIVFTASIAAWVAMTLFRTVVPVEQPHVDVVTTRCLGPDGRPVGDEYGQPCPSGTTQDTVVIQSLLPTALP